MTPMQGRKDSKTDYKRLKVKVRKTQRQAIKYSKARKGRNEGKIRDKGRQE
jgi:hypothetical protein